MNSRKEALRTTSSEKTAGATQALRILVVDDDRDTVLTLVAVLRHEGHDARGVYSGPAAIAASEDFEPQVVISDIAMPEMTGWDLARQLRPSGDKRGPILIAISGEYTKAADKALAQIAGFDHYLYKPCDPNVLLTLLARLQTPGN